MIKFNLGLLSMFFGMLCRACPKRFFQTFFGIDNGWNTGCNIVMCADNDGVVVVNNLFDYNTGNAIQLQKRDFFWGTGMGSDS